MTKTEKKEMGKCSNCGARRVLYGYCGACGCEQKPATKKAADEKTTPAKETPPKKTE